MSNSTFTEVAFEVASPLIIQILDSLSEVEETIVVEKELSRQIRYIAEQKGLSPQALIHKWLLEKVEKILEAK